MNNSHLDDEFEEAIKDLKEENKRTADELEAKSKSIKVYIKSIKHIDDINKELGKENKRMTDVVKAVNKFKWPDAREAGKIWEELYQALQALNSDTYGVDGNE